MPALASYLAQVYHRYILELQSAVAMTLANCDDPENLHKVRTTTRRILTLLKAFEKAFEPHFLKRAKPFFKNIIKQSNEARDIDVFLQNFESYKASLPPSMQEWIEPLRGALKQKRSVAYEKLRLFLNDDLFKRELSHLAYAQMRQKSLSAKKGIKRALERTKKELKTKKDLHSIRIVYKRLRYLTELLAPFKNVKKRIKHLKKMQDLLGTYHDLVVQRESVYHFATTSDIDNECMLAAGKLMGDLESRALKMEKRVKRKFHLTR